MDKQTGRHGQKGETGRERVTERQRNGQEAIKKEGWPDRERETNRDSNGPPPQKHFSGRQTR